MTLSPALLGWILMILGAVLLIGALIARKMFQPSGKDFGGIFRLIFLGCVLLVIGFLCKVL